jgi:hypothetical protein
VPLDRQGERAPRKKRQGRHGCYDCAEPTEAVVQVWMREYGDGRDAGGNRRQRTVKSQTISFCRKHAEEFYAHALERVPPCAPEPMNGRDLAHLRALAKASGR